MAQKRRDNTTLTLLLFLIIAVIADVFIFGTVNLSTMPRDARDLRIVTQTPAEDETPVDTKPTEPKIPDNITALSVDSNEIHFGELILVNNDHAFVDSPAPLTVKTESPISVYGNKTSDYVILDTSIWLNPTVIDRLNTLFADYKAYCGKVNIMINAAYRSIEDQTAIFAEKGADIAANPGYSEHHSGYALDICIYENGKGRTFADEEPYRWIPQNCAKYGFIRRYPDGKTALTGITFEPWHYRFVGVPHATYIMQNDLCFEEYIDLLKQYTYDGAHLPIDAEGKRYEVYYIPADGEKTTVYVPNDKPYTLSGNNTDGFIVTVDMTAQTVVSDGTDAARNEV